MDRCVLTAVTLPRPVPSGEKSNNNASRRLSIEKVAHVVDDPPDMLEPERFWSPQCLSLDDGAHEIFRSRFREVLLVNHFSLGKH